MINGALIPRAARVLVNTNFNDVSGTGFWIMYYTNEKDAKTTYNAPENVHCYLIQLQYNPGYRVQYISVLWNQNQSINKFYKRHRINNEWRAWISVTFS